MTRRKRATSGDSNYKCVPFYAEWNPYPVLAFCMCNFIRNSILCDFSRTNMWNIHIGNPSNSNNFYICRDFYGSVLFFLLCQYLSVMMHVLFIICRLKLKTDARKVCYTTHDTFNGFSLKIAIDSVWMSNSYRWKSMKQLTCKVIFFVCPNLNFRATRIFFWGGGNRTTTWTKKLLKKHTKLTTLFRLVWIDFTSLYSFLICSRSFSNRFLGEWKLKWKKNWRPSITE